MTDHARADQPRRDAQGHRIPEPVACVCGWQAGTSDGWDGLADWYHHVGILPPPGIDPGAVERFLGGAA